MTSSQPYIHHNMPLRMGLSQWDWQDFDDLIVLANKMQLEIMKAKIEEKQKRLENAANKIIP